MHQIKNHIPKKPQDRLVSLSVPQLETGTKEPFHWYKAWVRPSYHRYPCAGPFPTLLSHPTFCEAMKHGVLPPALSTVVGVHQSDYVQPHIRGYYVGHLESKERLRIQPAQLFNFRTHSTILHTVRTWHHRTFTSS